MHPSSARELNVAALDCQQMLISESTSHNAASSVDAMFRWKLHKTIVEILAFKGTHV